MGDVDHTHINMSEDISAKIQRPLEDLIKEEKKEKAAKSGKKPRTNGAKQKKPNGQKPAKNRDMPKRQANKQEGQKARRSSNLNEIQKQKANRIKQKISNPTRTVETSKPKRRQNQPRVNTHNKNNVVTNPPTLQIKIDNTKPKQQQQRKPKKST